jgi:putative membrane protein
MYIGKSYKLVEFIKWTRKSIYILTLMGTLSVLLYDTLGFKWIGISWTVVALLGTATAFIVGFKNTQTYNRTMEAQQIWTGIINASRSWGLMSRDFIDDRETTGIFINRHIAWLTALRYAMREHRVWESTQKKHNTEYQRFYSIPEREVPLRGELERYLSHEDFYFTLARDNKAAHLLGLQSRTIKAEFDKQHIAVLQFVEMERTIKELLALQGRSEQLKSSPYPRQYAIMNTLLVRFFCFLLPFGMLKEFDRLNDTVEGVMKGHMVWLVIPFSVIISWMYASLEQVGESTENPFEGGPNDVPITQISKMIEADLREMIDDPLPAVDFGPQHQIIL